MKNIGGKFLSEPYLIINLSLAGVIILILIYSGIFSPERDNYPVVCIHEKITGVPCVSCGLSHSLSLIIRGRVDEADQWNENGIRVFLFLTLQLLLRIVYSMLFIRFIPARQQWLITSDCILSAGLFIYAFYPFMAAIFDGL
jgi:hypothetical protein